MHDWQVNSLLRLGLCPKMKYPAFYAGIIIYG